MRGPVPAMQFITTNLMMLASLVVFNVNPLISLPIYGLYLLIDGSYLSANLSKFMQGARRGPS
jgi:K+ transporter